MKRISNDVLLVRILAATALAAGAGAQAAEVSASGQAASANDALEEVVVTAAAGDKTNLRSSVSVTDVSAQMIQDFQPSSESEVFRMIPGIQVNGTAGPGGNSNIAVRGLPVATGGSPFVQIQEDGLPTVLFGDIQFGNNDYWTHFDASVANVQSVRGGGSATYASQAPGAVINYISQTGKDEGGYIAVNKGVNFDENKVDFRYGARLNDDTYYHVGGYIKSGRGPLGADYNVSDSVQVKGNLTRELKDGKGYVRWLFKYADTQEPNYTGAIANASVGGGNVSGIGPYPGFDGRNQSNYSIHNQQFYIVNRDGVLERAKMDGITTHATALQNQFHYEFNDSVSVDNNARWTKMSGGFASPFFNPSATFNTAAVPTTGTVGTTTFNFAPGLNWCTLGADPQYQAYLAAGGSAFSSNGTVGSCVNGSVVDHIRYTSGPKAGSNYTDPFLNNNVNVRTNIRDIGSIADNLAITARWELPVGKLTGHAGWFFMNQKIAMDWHVDKAYSQVSGDNPSMLDLVDPAGNQLTAFGIAGYNNNWGDCCARDYSLSYSDQAPNFALDLETSRWDFDGSVRFDRVRASGWGVKSSNVSYLYRTPVGNGTFVDIPTLLADGRTESLAYTRSYSNWSLGALFKFDSNTSFFARMSRGGRFNGDRQTLSGKVRADGGLCTGTDVAAGGANNPCTGEGVTPSVDMVNQQELGVKNRGSLFGGHYSVEFTLLHGDFKQSTFELSATKCPGGAGGCIIDRKYKSQGAEFYATYDRGNFGLVANATYSDAKQAGGDGVFSRAENIPDLMYTIEADYSLPKVSFGLNTTGQTSSLNGGYTYPDSMIFGGFVRFRPVRNLELGIQGYNLADKFDVRGSGSVASAGTNGAGVISLAPAIGQTFIATVKYNF